MFLPQDIQLEKFAQRRPTCVDYDDRIQIYLNVLKDITLQPVKKEVEFILLDFGPLSRSLQENARQWVVSLGKKMNESSRIDLMALRDELEVSSGSLPTNGHGHHTQYAMHIYLYCCDNCRGCL